MKVSEAVDNHPGKRLTFKWTSGNSASADGVASGSITGLFFVKAGRDPKTGKAVLVFNTQADNQGGCFTIPGDAETVALIVVSGTAPALVGA